MPSKNGNHTTQVYNPEPDLTRLEPAPLPEIPFDDAQRLACLRLLRSENVGHMAFCELINRFGGATAALEALPELSAKSGGSKRLRICPADVAESELEAAANANATSLFIVEPGYPLALAFVEQPPPMLYVRGDLQHLQRPAVAVVGSREASDGGRKLARRFATGLSSAGYVIVSGLARGINAEAHGASLDGGTIAVVAGGIDIVYPSYKARLYDQIAEVGVIISEMAPGFRPRSQDFPRHNRIISGLSMGVIVVEAARRAGALVTARCAVEQGREVFAVPGHPLDPRASGANSLLKLGATPVTNPDDVIQTLAPQSDIWGQMRSSSLLTSTLLRIGFKMHTASLG